MQENKMPVQILQNQWGGFAAPLISSFKVASPLVDQCLNLFFPVAKILSFDFERLLGSPHQLGLLA
jgi:hypothetical protein